MSSAISVLLCGVGGQGTILAADLLAKVAIKQGLEVKLSEIHGMSQRGGNVTTMVRFGEQVISPVFGPGCATHIVSFELTEALRNLYYLADEGKLLVNDESIKSLPVLTGASQMPQNPHESLISRGAVIIPASQIALDIQNPKAANVVLLGALSAQLPFDVRDWEDVIEKRVPPKTIEANIKAFYAGRSYLIKE